MTIRAVLKHRAIVRRKTGAVWDDIAGDVPVLLDAGKTQHEPSWTQIDQQTADRSGILFTLPNSPIKPGDRVTLTLGATGTFVVKPDPSQKNLLSGPSHFEFRVEEVPGL